MSLLFLFVVYFGQFFVFCLGQLETIMALASMAWTITTLNDLANLGLALVPHKRLTFLVVFVPILDHVGHTATSLALDDKTIVDGLPLPIQFLYIAMFASH